MSIVHTQHCILLCVSLSVCVTGSTDLYRTLIRTWNVWGDVAFGRQRCRLGGIINVGNLKEATRAVNWSVFPRYAPILLLATVLVATFYLRHVLRYLPGEVPRGNVFTGVMTLSQVPIGWVYLSCLGRYREIPTGIGGTADHLERPALTLQGCCPLLPRDCFSFYSICI